MTRQRVLLVEDDASLRRFVRMALDELAIELLECADVASALPLLAQTPVDLILTDLMMPGESGLDLLQHLKQRPELRGNARVIVFSAGLNESVREALQVHNVWLMLDKPVAVSRMESSVRDALAATPASRPLDSSMAVDKQGLVAHSQVASPAPAAPVEDRAEAIRLYFEGSPEIFEPYREACLAQFPEDLMQGSAASQRGDLQDLRRVTHSLKSVLQTLGYPGLSDVAKDCEALCQTGDLAQARDRWAMLAAQLQWIVTAGQGAGAG